MSAAEPLVSVTILAFNHAKYIQQAIQSVLDQTHRDLEVVVVNDGSTDNTVEVLQGIHDPRVRVFHQDNQGPSAAANLALSKCRGKYVAIMAGDDLLPPLRIERQLAEYVKGESRILFAQVEFIDEDGNPSNTDRYHSNLTPAIGRPRVLRRLFDGTAPAFILTMFTEARILKNESRYCAPALYQLQDYELMIRLAKKYDFAYLDEKLYRFRLRHGDQNLSGSDPEKLIRTRNEFYLIMRNYFDGISVELFKEIFPDLVSRPDFSTPVAYRCEQAFVLLQAPTHSLRLLGAERLYDLLNEEEGRAVLLGEYGFSHMMFADTLKSIDPDKLYQRTCLYLDSGNGFSEYETVRRPIDHNARSFDLRFTVSPSTPLRMLRWDPVEGNYCKVWLESIAYEDAAGETVPLDLKQVNSNGVLLPDGGRFFDTLDPMYYLPVDRAISAVLIRGRWFFGIPERMERLRRTTLLPDRGSHIDEGSAVWQSIYVDEGDFSLVFPTTHFGRVQSVQWNPMKGCFCKVTLQSVTYRDASAATHDLDLTKIGSNGRRLGRGGYLFDTHDPIFFFPIEGECTEVVIRGRWSALFTKTEVNWEKFVDAKGKPSRWARWLMKGGMRKLRRLQQRFRPA